MTSIMNITAIRAALLASAIAVVCQPVPVHAQGACRRVESNWSTVEFTELLPDPAALVRDAPLFRRADRAVVTISYDSAGALVRSEVNVTGPFRERELDALRATVRAALPAEAAPHTRTRFLLTRDGDVRAEPFLLEVACRADVSNVQQLWDALSSLRSRQDLRPGTTHVRLLVDSRGEVMKADVSRSSGHTPTDQALLQVAQRARFAPARYNSLPVSVFVELPLVLDRTGRRQRFQNP